MKLNLEPNIADPDAFYERLIGLHADLTTDESHALNMELVRCLSAFISDAGVSMEAAALARAGEQANETPEAVAKLVLLLANHLGDEQKIAGAFAQARATITGADGELAQGRR